jgi:aminobenzoyl-glutamate transport protein
LSVGLLGESKISETAQQGRGNLQRFLDLVERVGNRLPHPFMIFVYLALVVILLSWVFSLLGVTVVDPSTEEEVPIESLVSGAGLAYMLTSVVDNFVDFPPLGTVLTIIFGIGLAQQVGLIENAMKKMITNAPPRLVTYAVVFTGILGNLASDAAFIIVPPLAAVAFLSAGKNPIAGLAAGFASAGAGFSANFFITSADALLSGISTETARTVTDEVVVSPVSNWYFMSASVPVLLIVGVLITQRFIEPRLGEYRGETEQEEMEEITPQENRGLRNALIAGVAYLAVLVLVVLPGNSPLRNPDGGLIPSPLLQGVVPIIFLFFVTVAVAYGVTVGKITRAGDVPNLMGEAVRDMSGFIVLIFAAAQFIAYFEYSNLGTWFAVNGAEFLQDANLTGLPALIGFILITTAFSFIIISGSALWAVLAPVFIPLFFLLDYNPAYVQAAYRIADSSTNVLTPLNPYVPLVLGFLRVYDRDAGFGTLFSLMLPYTVLFLIVWTVFFIVWSLIGLPVGPGETVYVNQ